MTTTEGPIELVLPGHSHYLRLARLVASGVVSTYGLTVDSVEDVRIAVDEVCAALMEEGHGEPVRLSFECRPDTLLVRGTARRDTPGSANDGRLAISRRILDVLADAHHFDSVDGQAVFTVTIPLRSRADHDRG